MHCWILQLVTVRRILFPQQRYVIVTTVPPFYTRHHLFPSKRNACGDVMIQCPKQTRIVTASAPIQLNLQIQPDSLDLNLGTNYALVYNFSHPVASVV